MVRKIMAMLLIGVLLGAFTVSQPALAAPVVLGVAGGGDQPWNTRRPADYALMKQAGATSLRADIPWEYLQPESATQPFDWALFDPTVADARAAGLDFLAILHMIPRWANGGRGNYYPPSNLALLTDYCYRTAQRYIPRGVTKYEIGNEVNLPHPGITLTGSWYVNNLLRPCVSGVRRAATEANRTVTILMAALAPPECCAGANPVTYLGQVYTAGGASLFNYLSWHPYTTDPLTHPNMNSVPDQLNTLTVQRTGASRQIWATEYGAPTRGAASVTEARQAQLVREATTAWFRKTYAGPLWWYAVRDLGSPPDTEREHFFGLLREDASQKPAYVEFKRVGGGV